MIHTITVGMTPPIAGPSSSPPTGTAHPAGRTAADPTGQGAATDSSDLLVEMGTLVVVGVLVATIVLLRRWLTLRSRRPLPGLPRERVLPLSRHGTLHDPKYLGHILQGEDPPPGA